MQLPVDNSLPLDPTNDALVVDRGDRPAPSLADLQALLPGWARNLDSPVRDALLAAWGAQANLVWARVGQLLARVASPRFAAGAWLRDWGTLLHRPQVPGEDDASFRARLLAPADLVAPAAIRDGVDPLVAADTPVRAVYVEPATDAAFAAPASGAPWTCFAQPRAQRLWSVDPSDGSRTRGAYVMPARPGAQFWIGLPVSPDVVGLAPHAMPAATAASATDFVMPAALPAHWTADDARFAVGPESTLLDRVAVEAAARRAGGVTAVVFADPGLVRAL